MTCREKYAQEYPDDNEIWDGMCPNDYGYLPIPDYCYADGRAHCEECWNREIPDTEPVIDEKKENAAVESIDIHKIIDDAMEKKNRSVFIHISPNFGTTVKVEPYDPTPKKWIRDVNGDHICPECGMNYGPHFLEGPYCTMCGEKLAQSILRDIRMEVKV